MLDTLADDLGVTDWRAITQADVDQFGRVTGDRQWIHTDAARASAESPFGRPIAHGMLVLAIGTTFTTDLLRTVDAVLIVHRGLADVRFLAPVPVGARIRGRGRVLGVRERRGCADITVETTIELDTGDDVVAAAISTQTLCYFADARWARFATTMRR
jgi:acyl dehydratase